MSHNHIGGTLDYRKLAELHRPTDAQTLRAACIELRSRGLTARDIAAAMGLAEPQVTALIGGNRDEPVGQT